MSDLSDLLRQAAEHRGLSNRRIAEMSGLSGPTVDRIMNGIGHPKVETVDKIAHALDIPVERAREAAGKPRGDARPYTPPAEANLLDERQRRAIDELIRAFVTTEGQTDDTEQTPQPQPRTETSSPQHRSAGQAARERPMNAASADQYVVSVTLVTPEHASQFEALSDKDRALAVAAIDRVLHGLAPVDTAKLRARGLLDLVLAAQVSAEHGGTIDVSPFPAGTTHEDVLDLRDRGVAATRAETINPAYRAGNTDWAAYTRTQVPDRISDLATDPTAPPPWHLADAARSGESEAERRRREEGDE